MRAEMGKFWWEESEGGRSRFGLQRGCCGVTGSRQCWALGVVSADGEEGGRRGHLTPFTNLLRLNICEISLSRVIANNAVYLRVV